MSHSAVSATSRQQTAAVAVACCLIACMACLLGLIGRPIDNLSSLWPANAIVLGTMLRFSKLSQPAGWLGAMAGFLLADMLIGSAIGKSLLLLVCNMASISVGYWTLKPLAPELRLLRSPNSAPYLIAAAVLAATAGSICGGLVQLLLNEAHAFSSAVFWLINETATYILILPVFLTLPTRDTLTLQNTPSLKSKDDWLHGLPLLSVIASGALCSWVSGPGAVAFMVPSLLWCALRYSLFSTALLTLVASCWALLVVEYGAKAQLMIDMSAKSSIESFRIGIALIALAPITVASVMAGHSSLLRRLNTLATRDQLTGLLNRRAFNERCNAYLNDPRKRQRPLAMLMLDLDHFKMINDTYGHQTGDHVLRRFAEVCTRCLREDDILGRLGGEEFAVLLPECAQDQAGLIAERIRAAYSDTAQVIDTLRLTTSVSIGVVTLPAPSCPLDEMLAMADKALYQAKHNGRNRVEVSCGITQPLDPAT